MEVENYLNKKGPIHGFENEDQTVAISYFSKTNGDILIHRLSKKKDNSVYKYFLSQAISNSQVGPIQFQ